MLSLTNNQMFILSNSRFQGLKGKLIWTWNCAANFEQLSLNCLMMLEIFSKRWTSRCVFFSAWAMTCKNTIKFCNDKKVWSGKLILNWTQNLNFKSWLILQFSLFCIGLALITLFSLRKYLNYNKSQDI